MIERPKEQKKPAEESDSESSDALDNGLSQKDDKKGTSQYHLVRALDKMFMLAGFGGLSPWIEGNPPCRILSPTEHRYGPKDCDKFEDHDAEVWQKWCVEDLATNQRRIEAPASRWDHARPLLTAFTDERGAQISLLQGLAYGEVLRIWLFADPFHRIWNDAKLALQETGLWPHVYERLHCEN